MESLNTTATRNKTDSEQQFLQFGASDHVKILHHGHNAYIPVALVHNGVWNQRNLPKSLAINSAGLYAGEHAYIGQQPIRAINCRGTVSNLSALSAFYVDLDHYNIDGFDGDVFSILDTLHDTGDDVPFPTLAANSGRGAYLIWVLSDTVPVSFLPQWQYIQNNLIQLLKPFGADPSCRDAVRVLGLAGSVNPKVNKPVEYYQVGDPVAYKSMQAWSNRYYTRNKSVIVSLDTVKQIETYRAQNKPGSIVKLTNKNGFTLAYARMLDIKALASLRGGKFTDCRSRAIFYYAVAASWFCHTVEALQSEVEDFVAQYIDDSSKYLKKRPMAVYRRKGMAIDGITIEWNGKEWDARYKPKNKTIIDALEMTLDEQAEMSVIIGKDIKYKRWNDKRQTKRRAAGVISREDYIDLAAMRKAEAFELREQGYKIKDIANDLGVSIHAINKYLKSTHEQIIAESV